MKWIYAFAAVALFASSALAYDVDEAEEAGDARLGYYSVANGVTSLTFNATSIQNAVVLLLFLGLIGALVVPLFLGGAAAPPPAPAPTGDGSGYGYGYGQEQVYDDATGYGGYAKRSLLSNLSPVLEALSSGHKKYEEEEQH